MRVPTPSALLITPGGIALSDAEKAEALADSLEAQFQPVTVPSVPAVIEMVNVELESYLQTPASEPTLSNPVEVHDAIRGLKVGKAPGPNGIPNRALKHLPTGRCFYSPTLQRYPIHPSLSHSLEARSGHLNTQTGEGSGAALILPTH